jgi:hypothetical protein
MKETPLNERDIRAQVHRLKSLPRSEEQPWDVLREELIRTLWSHSENMEHATAIVTAVIDSARGETKFCPTPGELAAFAGGIAAAKQPEFSTGHTRCERCGDTGFVSIKRKVRASPAMPEREYEYSAVCSCRKPTEGAA